MEDGTVELEYPTEHTDNNGVALALSVDWQVASLDHMIAEFKSIACA